MSYITELIAENVKKLRVVRIDAKNKSLIQITGGNGAGKTTVLDCIWFALKGQKALPERKGKWVRNGAERLSVQLTLKNGDKQAFTITRTLGLDGNPPTLSIEPKVHREEGKTPQAYLDDLFGALTFDPLAFAQMDTQAQVAELRKTAKVELDFEAMAKQDEEDYRARHLVNQSIRDLDAQIKGMVVLEGLPKKPIDTAPIVERLNQAGELNKKAQEVFQARQELGAKAAQLGYEATLKAAAIEEQDKAITQLEERLAAAMQKKRALHQEHDQLKKEHQAAEKKFQAAPAGEPVDVSVLTTELESANRTNRAIEQRANYDELKTKREAKEKESDKLSRAMEGRAEKKRQVLANAKIPVQGLTFDEREVKFNGIPIDQLGEGEQIRISTLIGMAANPKLRILCIRHGEALDDTGIKQIAELARENDFQVWMARVDTSGKVGIVLEDGTVAARNEGE